MSDLWSTLALGNPTSRGGRRCRWVDANNRTVGGTQSSCVGSGPWRSLGRSILLRVWTTRWCVRGAGRALPAGRIRFERWHGEGSGSGTPEIPYVPVRERSEDARVLPIELALHPISLPRLPAHGGPVASQKARSELASSACSWGCSQRTNSRLVERGRASRPSIASVSAHG